VFYTSALRFVEDETNDKLELPRSNLSRPEWTRAVIQGADDKSSRWRHSLLLGGTLLGFEGQDRENLPGDLRNRIEAALITVTNLALQEQGEKDANSHLCLVFVLNTVFPLLSDRHRAQLQYDILLPELVNAAYFSRAGLEHGYWLGTVDGDIRQASKTHFTWSSKSISAVRVQEIKSRPLVSSLGPLARLIAHAVENVRDANILVATLAKLADFSRNIGLSWRQNKFSEIEVGEESHFLDDETRTTTLPNLLQLIRNTLFSIIICLRAIIGRVITSVALSSDLIAPTLAIQALHILRDTYFISHRFGQQSSSQFMFVNYTAIDILNQFPVQAESFLAAVKSAQPGTIPAHPLDRLHDLFFLNTAEHLTLALRPEANQELLVNTAMPYITTHGDTRLNELYEAAHSVLLAVFASPQNGRVAAQHLPFYVETLLHSFPSSLTPRQFRLAIKSITQVAAPHSTVFVAMPALQEIIMEMLNSRLPQASEVPIPASDSALVESNHPQSEKSVVLFSMIDSLSFLPVTLLEDWLFLTAEALQTLTDTVQRSECQGRLWEVLSSGEMDVERAALCVAWWTSRGGKELVLYGQDAMEMSGALTAESKL